MQTELKNLPIEEYSSEGVIMIDRDGTIIRYNSKAKEILGISGYCEKAHQSGRLEPGDLLVFADTSVGADDGGVDQVLLKEYGVICDRNIEKKGLLYVGKMGVKKSVQYKIIELNEENIPRLDCEIDGMRISCSIDYNNKKTVICLDGCTFEQDYFLQIANVVILRNKELVFYQTKGYTARKESLKDIMSGAPFRQKQGAYNLEVEGTNIYSYHAENALTAGLVSCASGENSGYLEKKLSNINGFTVMASIHPVDLDGKRCGALLTMTDISTLEQSQTDLQIALNELEQFKRECQTEDQFPEIIGCSLAMKEVKRLANRAAKSDSNVLVLGESGTGKSFIAAKIHEKSRRTGFPFLEINCCAIPRELLESELFGYENGAFTGARQGGKKGIFEIADGGTVFLDEIGDMPLDMQAKLLLFIQKRSFYRVGGNIEIPVNVRIIAATNKNPEEQIQERRFREDLYYRLNILPIQIEALRNRREDIGLMVEHIMEKNNGTFREHKVLSAKANRLLLTYDYPGNIREMENIIERAFVLAEGKILYPEHLMLKGKISDLGLNLKRKTLDQVMDAYEKEVILEALKRNENNHIKTFEYLGIGKTCFYSKLKKYGITK